MMQVTVGFHNFINASNYPIIFDEFFNNSLCRHFPLSGTSNKHVSVTVTVSVLW